MITALVTVAQGNELVKPAQIRMARAALNWSLSELAAAAGVHRNTISNFETGRYAGTDEAISAMREALEAEGIEFLSDEGGAGVWLKNRVPKPRKARGK